MQCHLPLTTTFLPPQALVLDVKGILGAAADVPALLAKMITPPEPKALQQGAPTGNRLGPGTAWEPNACHGARCSRHAPSFTWHMHSPRMPPRSITLVPSCAALTSLRLIGALDSATGALTSLGQHLTRMPCDPRIGGLVAPCDRRQACTELSLPILPACHTSAPQRYPCLPACRLQPLLILLLFPPCCARPQSFCRQDAAVRRPAALPGPGADHSGGPGLGPACLLVHPRQAGGGALLWSCDPTARTALRQKLSLSGAGRAWVHCEAACMNHWGPSCPSTSKLRLPAYPAAQAEAARRSVAAAVAVSKSDHLAVVAAYNSWRAVLEKVGRIDSGYSMCMLVDPALPAGTHRHGAALEPSAACSARVLL